VAADTQSTTVWSTTNSLVPFGNGVAGGFAAHWATVAEFVG
jgi:hypothetical protein